MPANRCVEHPDVPSPGWVLWVPNNGQAAVFSQQEPRPPSRTEGWVPCGSPSLSPAVHPTLSRGEEWLASVGPGDHPESKPPKPTVPCQAVRGGRPGPRLAALGGIWPRVIQSILSSLAHGSSQGSRYHEGKGTVSPRRMAVLVGRPSL